MMSKVTTEEITSAETVPAPRVERLETSSEDLLQVTFPRHYTQKAFTADAFRLRDLARVQVPLTSDEQAEVLQLRRKIKRADADSVMLLVIAAKARGGLQFF